MAFAAEVMFFLVCMIILYFYIMNTNFSAAPEFVYTGF